ncbi:MAG TPA: ATP synthase F1 subunit epsilon [Planctomycetota bacterium]|nr:ATP synthase F1 subunit epsilon [Planctomycetota bacterium]
MKTLRLKIFTPDGAVFDGPVRTATLPATKGSMGVLPGHAPLVSSLETGVVKAETPEGGTRYFMVSGGFLEIVNDEIRVLADVGETDEAVDLKRAQDAAERARRRMRERHAVDFDLVRAEAALQRALTRLKVGELRTRGRKG